MPQPTTAVSAVLALPSRVRWLELDIKPCAGPLLRALARFSRLEELTIAGNGAGILWDVGPAAVAPLRTIRLDYRHPAVEVVYGDYTDYECSRVDVLPTNALEVLSTTTAVHTLELRVAWDDDVMQLCLALSGLQNLRWVSGLWKEAMLREATAVAAGGPMLCITTFTWCDLQAAPVQL